MMLNIVAIQEWKGYKDTGLKMFDFCPGFVRRNPRSTSEEARRRGVVVAKQTTPRIRPVGFWRPSKERGTQMLEDLCIKVGRTFW